MKALAAELGCDIFFDIEVTPKNNGSTAPKELVATDDALLRAANGVEELAGNLPPASCGTLDARSARRSGRRPRALQGVARATSDPPGNLFPCTQWVEPVGTLRETSFADLWSKSAELERIRSTRVHSGLHAVRAPLHLQSVHGARASRARRPRRPVPDAVRTVRAPSEGARVARAFRVASDERERAHRAREPLDGCVCRSRKPQHDLSTLTDAIAWSRLAPDALLIQLDRNEVHLAHPWRRRSSSVFRRVPRRSTSWWPTSPRRSRLTCLR